MAARIASGGDGVRLAGRDLSTAVESRWRAAQSSLEMTRVKTKAGLSTAVGLRWRATRSSLEMTVLFNLERVE